MEDYHNPRKLLCKAFTYSVYFNYKRNFRYKNIKTPIEILNDLNPTNINPNHIGIFPPVITDYHLDAVAKSGYHVPRSDRKKQKSIDFIKRIP